jgi:formylglycine-generating enzyme required for sulfatase activity
MSGNVWEWCLNKLDSPHSTTVDATNELRILRGGSFVFDREYAASSVRGGSQGLARPNLGWGDDGFRVGLFSAP